MNRKYNKEDILDYGMQLVRERGYHNTGINDILKASGIPKGSFYNFFSSKEEFGLNLLEYYGNYMLGYMRPYLEDESQSPLERLKGFYTFVIGVNAAEECRQGCLLNNMSSEVGGLSAKLAHMAEHQFNRWLDALSKCIGKGQEQGEITREYPARELAEFLHTSFFGGLTRAKMQRDSAPLKRVYRMAFDFITA